MSSDESPPEVPQDEGHIPQPENVNSPAAVTAQWATATATASTLEHHSTSTIKSAPFESKQLCVYTTRTEIGRGGFGVVFKAQHGIDERWYAIKQVDPVESIDMDDTKQSRNRVLREVRFLAELDHPHIVRYYDAWLEKPPPGEKLPRMDSNQSCLYIRMEWCSGSTLHEWLGQNRLPEQRPISQTLDWFSQLVSAVKYIHDKGLIHRDIKPQNIFFGSSPNEAASVLKIGDFGLAIDVAPSSSSGVSGSLSIVGTPNYMSPEQESGHYKNSTDIFSLGLVFLEMVHPFKTDRERHHVFENLRAEQRPNVMDKLDKTMDELISRMTAYEPENRATSSELDNKLNKKTDKEFRESRLLGEYTTRTRIGSGGFGVVFKAQHRIDKRWYAIKQVDPVDPVDMDDAKQSSNKVLREVHFLAKLDHPHIVRYCDAWLEIPPTGEKLRWMDSNELCLYIRMEWCSGSTLHEWLGQNRLPEQRPISQTLGWFSQLVSAVKYIHDAGLIHRDIKPQNIFFGSSRNGAASVLKIGDLGLATYAAALSSSGASGDVSKSLSIVGTPSYMSPEQPSGHYTNSTDIFSLGLVFLEIVQPFKKNAERDTVFGALRAKQRPAVMNKLDKKMDELISWMTEFELENRATSSELDNELKKMRKMLSMLETNFTDLPLKLTLKIFGYLYEGDLARCALVSRKFRAITNHQILWKSLYQEVFEYSLPLLHVSHGQFEFREPHDWPQPRFNESIVVNPWKESFKQLKHGVHVRPWYAPLYSGFGAGGRRLTQCDQLDEALQLVEARDENVEKLIFLHTGLYIPRTTVTINSDIQIIGASAGPDIASRVTIEGRLDTTVALTEGSQDAYLGWMTVRFAPDSETMAAVIAAENLSMRTYPCALQICDDSTALVEHCVIRSSVTVGVAVCVEGRAANSKMRHCVVCDCESMGIYMTDAAQGQFEDCEIARNNGPGIWVDKRANPLFRRCHIHGGRNSGIFTFDYGMGYFESCSIHNNRFAGIVVWSAANPTVTRCEVHHGQQNGIRVHPEGRGQFSENQIHSNALAGIIIKSHSDPKIARNKIWGNQDGVIVSNNRQGVLKDNEISDNIIIERPSCSIQ